MSQTRADGLPIEQDHEMDATDLVVRGLAALDPDLDLESLHIIDRLVRVGKLVHVELDRAVARAGLRFRGDYELLSALVRSEPVPLTPADLASALSLSSSGITGRLDRLESAKLITRDNRPEDRRSIYVRVTDKGREVFERALHESLEVQTKMTELLSGDERRHLADLLRRFALELQEPSNLTPGLVAKGARSPLLGVED